MFTTCRKWMPALGALALACSMIPSALAQCGSLPKQAHPASLDMQSGQAHLTNATFALTSNDAALNDEQEHRPSIVGMWHVTFTAEGNQEGPPNGTPIDNAIIVWHSDHTEIMNSGRPPQDGAFCMGVWEETARCKYKLNHFAWAANDTTNAPGGIGNPAGPTHIVEEVTLSPDGKHYTGRFTLEAFDTSGNRTAHIVGETKGTRITMNTTVGDLL